MVTATSPRRAAVVVAVVLAVASATGLVWNDLGTSYRTTWELTAAGTEGFAPAATLWEAGRNVIVPVAAGPLVLAPLGPSFHFVAILLLALLWTGGARRLALAAGASEPGAIVAGIGSAVVPLAAAEGNPDLLGAGALLWALAGGIGAAGTAAAVTGVVLLAFVSRSGLELGLPLLVGVALWRGASDGRLRPVVPAGVALLLFWLLPRPPWADVVLRHDPWMFLAGAPYALPSRGLAEIAALPFFGENVSLAAGLAGVLLWGAAFTASLRGGPEARRLGIVLLVLGLIAAGGRLPGVTTVTGLAGPAEFLVEVVPSLALQPLSRLAALLGGVLVLALVATWRQGGIPIVAGTLLLVLTTGTTGNGSAPDRPSLESLPKDRAALALPLAIGSDRSWQRANRDADLRNGTQAVLEANAPLLAELLDPEDLSPVFAWARRLNLSRLVVPVPGDTDDPSPDDWRTVSVPPRTPVFAAPCLPAERLEAVSSQGRPEVTVPARAVDGDPATRWGTGAPQQPGQFFEIRLHRPTRVQALELEPGPFRSDYPRGFRVLLRNVDGSWREVVRRDPWLGEVVWNDEIRFAHPAGPRNSAVKVRLGDERATGVRIELTRGTEVWDWSIAELCLRGGKG